MEPEWFQNSFLVPSIEILGVDSVKELWSKVPTEAKKKTEKEMKLLRDDELFCKKTDRVLKAMKNIYVMRRLAVLNEVTSLLMEKK
ncbi:hypothetical protein EUTSA_v10028244mg [Eutrema salsugineum]|uniref:Glabrous enhancer-binding protein-like C-terminal domain-containing protein n=1 Tax=Eutrema salsugineum TaxID=72664 RepID=V4LAE4_EUTSA|nr:hypothetical protein EUTSA_v10028244mg [Eutrema salsugineum]